MTTLLDILIIAFTILCSIAIATSLIVFISSKIKYWVIACSIPTEPKPDYLWKTMMDSRTPEEFQVEKDMAFVELRCLYLFSIKVACTPMYGTLTGC